MMYMKIGPFGMLEIIGLETAPAITRQKSNPRQSNGWT